MRAPSGGGDGRSTGYGSAEGSSGEAVEVAVRGREGRAAARPTLA